VRRPVAQGDGQVDQGSERDRQVGAISANGDTEIGDKLAEAMEKVGKEGVITVEESKTAETTLEVVEGMQFDRGYFSPYFVTDPERMEVVLDDAYLLISEKEDLEHEGSAAGARGDRQAGEASGHHRRGHRGEALATLVVNKLRGTLHCAAVKAPGFGDRRKEMLADIATLTGAQVISEELGLRLENVTVGDLGRAKRVTMDKDNTTLVDGAGSQGQDQGPHRRDSRADREHDSDYDKEKLQERLAKLVGGVAIVKVGAATETEMKEKKARVEDALHATRAAVEEGIVAGGGVALIRAQHTLDHFEVPKSSGPACGSSTGRSRNPCARSRRTRAWKARSWSAGSRQARTTFGYNAATDHYGRLIAMGVIDPVKVVRTALQNAASVAGLMLTTECLIAERPKGNKASAGDHAGQKRFLGDLRSQWRVLSARALSPWLGGGRRPARVRA